MNTAIKITLSRIVAIPVVIAVYLIDFTAHKIVTCALFTFLACTDFIDGHIARSRNQVTDLGKFLDPIADKILVVVFLFLLVGDNTLPHPWGAICCGAIIMREFIISAFRLLASTKNIVISADAWGKAKTVFTDVAIAVLIISGGPIFLHGEGALHVFEQIFYIGGSVIFYISVALTIYSGIHYILKNKNVFSPVAVREEQPQEPNDSDRND